MIKVCFDGMYSVMDSTSANLMREVLIDLVKKNSHIEFWFTGCHNGYQKVAVKHIREIKKMFPENQIEIVVIIDPLKSDVQSIEELDELRTGFSRGIVDKIEYAPLIEGKCELIPNRFVEHYRKVFRWIVEQCDVLIAYHYDGVPDSTNTELKRIRKKGNTEIISVYNPEVAAAIDSYINNLEGRDKIILQGIRSGRTYKSLSEELGISHNRVQQISHQAIRYMMKAVRDEINS